MSEEEMGQAPAHERTPPTEVAAYAVPERPSSWPIVVGIIAIVLAVLDLLGSCGGIVTPFFADAIKEMAPAGQPTGMEFMQQNMAWTVGQALLSMGAAVLLLVAAIGLMKRRAWAVQPCLVWAILKIVLVLIGVVTGYAIAQETFESVAQQTPGMPGMSSGLFKSFAVIGMCFGLVFGLALPVFMLIWFSRAKIKAEVAGWA